MDISGYISDLLYEHDCVIIPGFGGFICNYKPAQINKKLHTISPPSKAISFNVNLQTNDGLLVNHISTANNVSFDVAQNIITTWIGSSKSLLKSNDEIVLRNIGNIFPDPEGSLQFVPDDSVNYLKSSYGLRTITAVPVYGEREISLPERTERNTAFKRSAWKIAAVIFLIAAIGTLINLMLAGVEIKSLVLDEASVFSFISHITSTHEPDMKPIPVEVIKTAPAIIPSQVLEVKEKSSSPVQSASHGYYIIIGAFAENKNIEAAKTRLLQKFPASALFVEKSNRLTRIGYLAGNDFNKAKEELQQAQAEDSHIWMLRK